ncbi:MAG: MFS transporter [Chloroflexota bacterium]
METTQSLGQAAKRRGLIVILIDTFLMLGGFFMLIPLISVHYVDNLGWAAVTIGIILGVRQFLQQGFTVIGGALADRFGPKGLMCLGLFIRTISFVAMAWASTFPLLMATTALSAIGGALFDSPRLAAITALTSEQNRSRVFSIAGTVGGVGMTLGPLIGAALIRVDFAFVCLTAAAFFFVAFLITTFFLPSIRPVTTEQSDEQQGITHGIRVALRDRRFVLFVALSMGFWFMWVQLTISLPLMAQNISGTTDTIGLMYGLNSVMIVLLQYPLLRLVERWFQSSAIVTLGMLITALSLGGMSFVSDVPMLLVCVALFSLGVMLVMPSQQTVVAGFAPASMAGSYFGVSLLAMAIGGGLGNFMGGLLYDMSLQSGMSALPWMTFFLTGLVSACGLGWMYRHQFRGEKAPQQPAMATRHSR